MILKTHVSGILAMLAVLLSLVHAHPTMNATTHMVHGNLSMATSAGRDPDGYGPVDEGTMRCLSAAGIKYHPHHICDDDWDDSWTGGKYFMYEMEFHRLMGTPKYRGMSGSKVSEAACDSFKKNWRASGCQKGRDEKHAFCCRVFRIQEPIKEPSIHFVNGKDVYVWNGEEVSEEEFFRKLRESGVRYHQSPEEVRERLDQEKEQWGIAQGEEKRRTGEEMTGKGNITVIVPSTVSAGAKARSV